MVEIKGGRHTNIPKLIHTAFERSWEVERRKVSEIKKDFRKKFGADWTNEQKGGLESKRLSHVVSVCLFEKLILKLRLS